MPDMEKILRLVAEGALTPEEADEVLAGLSSQTPDASPDAAGSTPAEQAGEGPRRLRIEVREGGRRVVNLSVPLNIASLAGAFVPGLSEEDGERIRSALRTGLRGPIVDVGSDDGDRVLIVSE
ncbi:MAG TPA: hypothetical protein VMP67_00055 [Candidatus Limnocylindria bacterium]|nr:hypothetical protein [Candidatus Limnocylindria bacterium]